MGKRLLVVLVVAIMALSMASLVVAAEIKAVISKVADDRRSVTVKNREGAETTYTLSRATKYEGIASRDELKADMKVTINSDDGKAANSIAIRP